MKSILALTLFALTILIGAVHGIAPAACLLILGSAALIEAPGPLGSLCTVTLTPAILLQQTMRKLFVKCPALSYFAHEFTTERVKLNQTVTGKIRLRPTASTYDGTTGYKNGSQEGRDLLLDVPFVMDQHIHVTLKIDHLSYLTDSMQAVEGHIADSASAVAATRALPMR